MLNKPDLNEGCASFLPHLFKAFFGLLFVILITPSAMAAADDYAVAGGNPGSLPLVGATTVALPTITITDAGGDDVTNDPENIIIDINTGSYPFVVLDSTVTSLTIAGTCGYTGHNAVTYSNADQRITIPITGGTNCGAGETITITDLKVGSFYAAAAPGAAALITVDNGTTSAGSPVGTSDTVNLAAGANLLASTNVQPADLLAGATSTSTISFTNTNPVLSNGKIKITYPSGFDVSGATGGNCTTMDGSFATSVSSQVVTLTRSGGSIELSGAQTCVINGITNPDSTGTTGTYTISTTNLADGVMDQDAAVTADTIQGGGGSGAPIITPYMACEDGIDNDGDGFTDLNDPGCDGFRDNSEEDVEEKEEVSTGGTENTDKEVEEKKEEKKEEKAPEKTEEKSGGSAVSAEVKANLKKLINYFNIRYQIKCKAKTANTDGDLCRWAKIDMAYAQKMTGETKAPDLKLSDREIEITQKRLKWTKARYQKRCVEADIPHKSCKGLKQAIDRAEYFIEKKSE